MIITPDTKIKELYENGQISIRTYHGLDYSGFDNVQNILSYIEEGNNILNIRNLGRKSESEIIKVKEKVIFTQNDFSSDNLNQFLIPNELRDFFVSTLNKFIKQNPNCSSFFIDRFSKAPGNLYQNIKFFNNEFVLYPDLSKDDNLLYRKTFYEFVLFFTSEIKKVDTIDLSNYKIGLVSILQVMHDCIHLKQSEELYYISTMCDSVLQQEFSILCENLSVRSSNFISSYKITYKRLVPLFNKPMDEYGKQLCPRQSLKKTLEEIFDLNRKFEKVFNNIYKLSDCELNEIQLKIKYPFLLLKQRHFVTSFEEEHGYIPCFMLLYNYLRFSEDRSDKLYSLYYGIFDNCPKTLDDLAELYSLSKERVRQIIRGQHIIASSLFFCNGESLKSYSSLFQRNIVTDCSEEFKKIVITENLNISFNIFAALTCVFSDYHIDNVKGKTILVSNSLNNYVKIKDVLNILESILIGHYSKDTAINVNSIIGNVPQKYEAELKKFVIFVLQNEYGIPVNGNGYFTITQNYVDVELELVSILEDNGRPMYLQDLFERFNLIYPKHRAAEPEKLRPYILKSSRLKPIGRQSLYGLDTWNDVFFGTISEFIVEVLNESKSPLKLEYIFSRVVENFPNTTIKSIASFMCDAENFISFQDNNYGLRGKNYSADFIEEPTISRYRFEERISMFRDFVTKYERYPLASGGDTEGSLQRWYFNVLKGVIDTTYEQRIEFNQLVEEYTSASVPQSETENKFYNNCIEYKYFLKKFHKLPNTTNGEDLYSWFNRSKSRYEGFIDNRYKYFRELIVYIESFGFKIEH